MHTASDVIDALIREYLVKRGFTATVDAFNKEKPKHSNSITKSVILRSVLGLDSVAAEIQRKLPTNSTLPPILEFWVQHQMTKLNSFMQVDEPTQTQRPRPPQRSQPEYEAEESSMPEQVTTTSTRRSSRTSAVAQSVDMGPPRASPQAFGAPGGAQAYGSPGDARTAQPRPAAPRPAANAPPQVSPSTSSSDQMSRQFANVRVSGGQGGAARPAATMQQHPPQRHRQEEFLLEEVDDAAMANMPALTPTAPVSRARASALSVTGTPVPPDSSRAIRLLLWGALGIPPPSWHQGLFFCDRPGLEFGLVQRQGGPCGVLAALQAHILAALRVGTRFTLRPSHSQRCSALAAAITSTLWGARSGAHAVLVLFSSEGGMPTASMPYEALARAALSVTATSQNELQASVEKHLSQFMDEGGWGIIQYLFSLLLTRGVNVIRSDMDEPGNSLMGAHGYCTQELVNLILVGTAVSNVHDGQRELEPGTMLKGIPKPSRLGLLTLFEWYKYIEVGRFLKNPEIPVWVVCSESHFTVLFNDDARAARNALPFDLFYYDELANQESIVRLTLTPDPKGGWTQKVGNSFGDRGKCEGQNIPPLECVIETRWPGVSVNWNGMDPIL